MDIAYFGYDAIATTVLVIISGASLFILFNNVYKTAKDIQKPNKERDEKINCIYDKVENLEKMASKRDDRINEFIDKHRNDIRSIKEENVIQTKAIQTLLRHDIDGNDIEALKERYEEINEHLLDRGVNKHIAEPK